MLSIRTISLFSLFFLAVSFGMLPIAVSAQHPLDVSIEKLTQQPKDKSLPLKITVTSQVDSDRLELRLLPPSGLQVLSEEYTLTQIKADETLEFEAVVKPLTPGDHDLQVKVQAWQADENLVATEAIRLTFADDLQIQPQTNEYQILAARQRAVNLAIYIGIATVIIAIAAFAYYRFKAWLDAD